MNNTDTDPILVQLPSAPEPKQKRRPHTSTWKAIELKLARILGGERVPVTGRTIGSAPDIEHPRFSLEVKHGKQIPKLIQSAMLQALMSVRKNKIPMVIMHPEGTRIDESLVIIRIKDLDRICANCNTEETNAKAI